jgi:hypothetical protein
MKSSAAKRPLSRPLTVIRQLLASARTEKLLLVAGVRPVAASLAVQAIRRSSSTVELMLAMNKSHSQLFEINTENCRFIDLK